MRTARLLDLVPLEDRTTPADLRVVTYNITAAGGDLRAGLSNIVQAIGSQTVGGLARPVDILCVQETDSNTSATGSTADVTALLNGIYGAGTYADGNLNGGSTGSGTQGVIFRTSSVSLIAETAIGTTGASAQARQTMRHQLRPAGTTGGDDFFIYNAHYKSDTGTANQGRRTTETNAILADAATLPATANVLYVGDFNIYSSSETAYSTYFNAGNGQAYDAANPANNWTGGNNTYKAIYTQAPSANPPSGLTSGGLDDRFDFVLMSTDLNNGSGADYRAGSYHTFGNNGTTAVNGSVNDAGNTALANTGLTAAAQQTVLDYLTTFADHLPVVADFTVPSPSTFQFTSANLSVGEGAGQATITVTRSPGVTATTTVVYTAAAGTATAGSDFTAVTGTLTFTSGATSAAFTVPIVNDALNEPAETVLLTLSSPGGTGASLGTPSAATLTINDNDPLTAGNFTVNGGAIQRSQVTQLQLTFNGAVSLAASNFTVSGSTAAIGVATTSVGGQTLATLTFGGPGSANGSVVDGYHTLTVTGVTGLTGTTAFAFHRYLGDFDGDTAVDGNDLAFVASAFNTVVGDANYRDYLDLDGDGAVDGNDLAIIAQRFNTVL